jgi:hypothetical protein
MGSDISQQFTHKWLIAGKFLILELEISSNFKSASKNLIKDE